MSRFCDDETLFTVNNNFDDETSFTLNSNVDDEIWIA